MTEIMERLKVRENFEKFVQHIQAVVDAYYKERFPNLPSVKIVYEEGSVYWRVVNVQGDPNLPGSKTVYGFVRREDGAIFKAAGWKMPAVKSGIRGFVDNYPDELLSAYGISYKKMGSIGPTVYPKRPD